MKGDVHVPRPVGSHHEAGGQALLDGVGEKDCPLPAGSLAAADWVLGRRLQALDDGLVLAADEPDEDSRLEVGHRLRTDVYYARSERLSLIQSAEALLPDAETAAARIGLPTRDWPANCYGVSSMLLEAGVMSALEQRLGPAAVRYGIYDGPIARDSIFGGRDFARHGWIEFEDGTVVDPTRWVFEAGTPRLWVGSIDEYDLGANRLKARIMRRPAPEHDPSMRQIPWDPNDPAVSASTSSLLRDPALAARRTLALDQAFWLANLPPEALGEQAKAILGALSRAGCGAFIPVDNRILTGVDASTAPLPAR